MRTKLYNKVYFDKDEPTKTEVKTEEEPVEDKVNEETSFSFLAESEDDLKSDEDLTIPEVDLEDIGKEMDELFDFEPGEKEGEKKDETSKKDNERDKDKEDLDDDETGNDDPAKSAEKSDKKDKDDKVVDKDKEPEKSPEVLELKSEIESLKTLIQQLQPKKEEKKEEPVKIPEIDSSKILEQLKDVDFDKITDSKEEFLKFMVNTIALYTQENNASLLGTIPSMVETTARTQEDYGKVREDFYSAHPKLEPIKEYVATVAQTLAKDPDNANKTVGEILENAAKVSYETLGIDPTVVRPTEKKEEPSEKKEEKKPKEAKLPGAKTVRSKGEKASELEKEMDELFEDYN